MGAVNEGQKLVQPRDKRMRSNSKTFISLPNFTA